ncbi:MAG: NAD(P)/FAD-dependent oxidoreductase [Treponema sp.]|jgi:geranylgeranyl reductase family protein|nr:NAD(P)/FAD-dependent oxidoreductase [Treponema sp.]
MKTIEREVIVVGAGPGGSACAAYLARAGVDVLLLDKEIWPRDKPCGDGQTARAIPHIKELGFFDEFASKGFMSQGSLWTAPNHSTIEFPAGGGYCTPRRIFDDEVRHTAMRFGAEMIENAWVYDVILEDGFVKGVKAKINGEYLELRSKLVVGADGSHSLIAQKIGMFHDTDENACVVGRCYVQVDPKDFAGKVEIHLDKDVMPGYVWIFPERNNIVNLGLGFQRSLYNKSTGVKTLQETLRKWIEESPFGKPVRGKKWIGEFRGWRIPNDMGVDRKDNYVNGCMLIGDAASLIVPFSGEGVGPAMDSALIVSDVAQTALKKNDFSGEVLKEYKTRYDEKNVQPVMMAWKMNAMLANQDAVNAMFLPENRQKLAAAMGIAHHI